MRPKKVNKKALEYVRPVPGTFTLKKCPGHEFKFRTVSIDDEPWVKENFGKPVWAIMTSKEAEAADLCRLYFHFLDDASKELFIPEKREERDWETGELKEVVISGPRLFMKSIDGGSLTEMTLISRAFFDTLVASRPISDLPDELKKNILKALKEMKSPTKQTQTESGPKPLKTETQIPTTIP